MASKEENARYKARHPEQYKLNHIKYNKSPKGKYAGQKRSAKKRNIEWLLTFEEWWKIWQDSGKWGERGGSGYQMCRKGDKGPYSVDNIYIAHHIQNKKDAKINGRIGGLMKFSDEFIENLYKELQSVSGQVIREIAKKYNMDWSYLYKIKNRKVKRMMKQEMEGGC